jgi:flavin-dependent dehydrogenase
VDAGGRAAPLARRLGARLRRSDRLIARWTQGAGRPDGCGAGVTHVEAVESGWWYTAPAPGGRRLLAFHTDGDLPAARARNLLARAHEVRELGRILAGCGFAPDSPFRSVAAHTAVLEPATGADWLAAGDAALGLDPLSSQGLLNALYMGLAAAESVARSLEGDIGALADYAATLRGIETAYRRNLGDCYGSERRWPDAPFWRRRMAAYVEAGSHG